MIWPLSPRPLPQGICGVHDLLSAGADPVNLMQVPFVGFQPLRTSEHMAAAGVFLLLYAYAALKYMQVCVCVRMLCTCTYYVHWYVCV